MEEGCNSTAGSQTYEPLNLTVPCSTLTISSLASNNAIVMFERCYCLKVGIFWDTAPCGPHVKRGYEGLYLLDMQG
jgi:hypothetical protein